MRLYVLLLSVVSHTIVSQTTIVIHPMINTGHPDDDWLGYGLSLTWSQALSGAGLQVPTKDSLLRIHANDLSADRMFSETRMTSSLVSSGTVTVTGFFYSDNDTLRLSVRSYDDRLQSPTLLIDGLADDPEDTRALMALSLGQLLDHLKKHHRLDVQPAKTIAAFNRASRPSSFFVENIRASVALAFQEAAAEAAGAGHHRTERVFLEKAERAMVGTSITLGEKKDLLTGLRAFEAGRFEEARRALSDYAGSQPRDPQAWKALSQACVRLGLTMEALAALRELMLIDPDDTYAYVESGRILGDQKHDADAKAMYLRAVELDPFCSPAFSGMAILDWKAKRIKPAIAHFEKALSLDSTDATANYALGIIFAADKRRKKDAPYFLERCLRLHPNHPQALEIRKTLSSLTKKKKK